ncbi:MAG: hypothetical protein AB8H80_13900 [Planctomycetota bacterium]
METDLGFGGGTALERGVMKHITPSVSFARLPSAWTIAAAMATASIFATARTSSAQNIAIFPDEYAAVPEGPSNSNNLPLALGTSRVMCLYEAVDLAIPSGDQITKLGFRQDGANTQLINGVALQLEVRMGFSNEDSQSMSTTFDNNYDGASTTVFGPALYTPPNLHDPGNPLPNGQLFINLTTPFAYVPNGRNLVVEYRIFGTANGGQSFNYRLDRADFYSPRTSGPVGCPHSGGGTPTHTVDPARPGINFNARVSQGPSNSPAFLAVNIGTGLTPPYPLGAIFPGIATSCTGQMAAGNFGILGGTTNSNGARSWGFLIPNDNVFADLTISSQTLFLDFFSPGQVVTSNGVETLTGVRPRTALLSSTGAPTTIVTGSKQVHYCPVAFFEHQ